MKRNRAAALGLAVVLPVTGMFAGCASNSTGITPDYKNSATLLDSYGEANVKGKEYVEKYGVLPPIPLNIFALQEKMHQERADVDSNWFRAYGFEWADDISEISEAGPAEQIAYGVAILNGALNQLAKTDHDAYHKALIKIEDGYDRVFGKGNHDYKAGWIEHSHSFFTGDSKGNEIMKHNHDHNHPNPHSHYWPVDENGNWRPGMKEPTLP